MTRGRALDVVALFAVLALGYVSGESALRQYRAAGNNPFFYQSEFGPAVSFACGLGYRNVRYTKIPALSAFLDQRSDGVDCASVDPAAGFAELDSFQGISRYLEMSVGLWWRVRGVAWTRLDPLFGMFYAVTLVLAYGLFRLGAGPILAILATAWVALSPLQLLNLPGLRDFAKAPFVLGLILLTGLMLRERDRLTRRRMLSLAALTGAVAGVGLGFRNDLLLVIPLVFAGIVAFGGGGARRAARAAAFTAAFAVTALPVVFAYTRGSNTAHVVLLGMTTPFDAPLKLQRPIYDVGYLYNDSYVYVLARAYADRVWSATGPMLIGTKEYDRATSQYLSELARLFPADILVRGYASVAGVFRVPFDPAIQDVTPLRGRLARLVAIRQSIVPYLMWPVPIAAVALVLYAFAARRADLCVTIAIVAVLCAGAALQFHPRHFFYLESLTLWPLIAAGGALRGVMARRRVTPLARTHWIVAISALLAVSVAAAVLLWAARTYQQRRVRSLIRSLVDAPSEPQPLERTPIPSGAVRISPPVEPRSSDPLHPVSERFYAVDIGGGACDAMSLSATWRYSSTRPFDDFSRRFDLDLPLDGGLVTLYGAAYRLEQRGTGQGAAAFTSTFQGIELPAELAGCVSGIRRVADGSAPLVGINVVVTPGWQQSHLYQQLWWEERQPQTKYIVPQRLSRRTVARALGARVKADLATLANTARRDGERLVGAGSPEGPYTYVAAFAPHAAASGDVAIATGTLSSGGLTVGLVRDGAWAVTAEVHESGPFAVVLAAPAAGQYDLVVANSLRPGQTRNRFVLDRAGWEEVP